MKKYFVYETPKGNIKIFYSDKGVSSVVLPYDEGTIISPGEYLENEKIRNYFDDYFKGLEPEKIELDLDITAFQKKVFDILLNTKMGTYMTYGDVAKLINCGSNQAIGQALKRNPVPIIVACHRIIGKGWAGGYAGETSGTKMEFKEFLLQHEKIKL